MSWLSGFFRRLGSSDSKRVVQTQRPPRRWTLRRREPELVDLTMSRAPRAGSTPLVVTMGASRPPIAPARSGPMPIPGAPPVRCAGTVPPADRPRPQRRPPPPPQPAPARRRRATPPPPPGAPARRHARAGVELPLPAPPVETVGRPFEYGDDDETVVWVVPGADMAELFPDDETR